MWINIIGENFKELLLTLRQKPIVIIVLGLIFLSGFFINKWTMSTDDCTQIIRDRDKEISNVKDTLYMYKYESKYYQELYKRSIDSINNSIRETFKPLENQKN